MERNPANTGEDYTKATLQPKQPILRGGGSLVPGLSLLSPLKRASTTITQLGDAYGQTFWEKHGRLIGGIIGGVVSAILVTWATYCIRRDKKQKEEIRERAAQINSQYGLPFTRVHCAVIVRVF
ncbi:hypothetical protein DER46DRAFT_573475 [Fusarium sp. MPI-SDFR-AT-0072]|nr:hypothetical protein DER46DRAFT_573475 [Fusarium sp. MPI-SDFR-AT-0072]